MWNLCCYLCNTNGKQFRKDAELILHVQHDNNIILVIWIVSIDLMITANDDIDNIEKINKVCSVEYLGVVNTCWIIVDMEFVK